MDDIWGGAVDRMLARKSAVNTLDNRDPSTVRRANRVGASIGQPGQVVEADLDGFENEAKHGEAQSLFDTFPGLAAFAVDPQRNAAIKDDLPTMSQISGAFNMAPKARLIPNWRDALQLNVATPAPRAPRYVSSPEGALATIGQTVASTARGTGGFLADMVGAGDAYRQSHFYKEQTKSMEYFGNIAEAPFERLEGNYLGQQAYRAGQSLSVLGASLLTGAPIAAFGISTGAESYERFRERGAGANEALAGAVVTGGAEAAFEKYLGLGWMLGNFGKRATSRFVGGLLLREVPGEMATTATQNLADALVTGGAGMDQYLKDLPKDLLDTAVSTTMMVGALGGINAVARRARPELRAQEDIAEGIAGANFLGALMDNAAKSKLKSEDPGTLRAFVEQHAENSPVRNVYFPVDDVVEYMQAEGYGGEFDQFQDQVNEAQATADSVAIPLADAAAYLSGTPAWEALKESARATPGGFSLKEAREKSEELFQDLEARGAALGEEAKAKGVEQGAIDEAFEDIKNSILATGRVPANVAEATARIAAARYAVRGAEQGQTPLEAWKASGISILGADETTGEVQGRIMGQTDEAELAQEEPLAGMPQRIKVDGQERTFGPYRVGRQAAAAIAKRLGLAHTPPATYARVDTERAARIATEFELMEHNPSDPQVAAAYKAMIDETVEQYKELMKTGLKVEFITGADPYGNPRNAILDVVENNHLWVYPTDAGFGGPSSTLDVSDNPLLAVVPGIKISGRAVRANDLFRVVHDFFGHITEGVGFRADGEENAWRIHSAMYSPLARRAMTTETRGQNSWVNFGPFGEKNRTASGADTEYAPQKIGLLPEWVSEEGATDQTLDQSATIGGYEGLSAFLNDDEKEGLREAAKAKLLAIATSLPDAEEMAAVALSGRAKRGWYENSAQAILDVFGAADAPRFAALLAALSPQTSVESNLYNALKTWTNWNEAGRPTDRQEIIKVMGASVQGGKGVGSVLTAWINNSVTALQAENPAAIRLSGPKVDSFMNNLVGVVDEVTNDAWMSNYAAVDPALLAGRKFPKSAGMGDAKGKGPGYKAMSAVVRAAADILTRKTGELWTPAEVQETVWSFAKTLYERRDSKGETKNMRALLEAGHVTHDDIANTPDFAVLFADGVYRTILEEAGYGEATQSLGRNRRAVGVDGQESIAALPEGSGFSEDAYRQFLGQAADRLEGVRAARRGETEDAQQELFQGDVFNSIPNGPAVDPIGRRIAFHGTPWTFDEFRDNGPAVWFSEGRQLAERYADGRRLRKLTKGRVIEAELNIQRPLRVDDAIHTTPSTVVENPVAWAKEHFGFDLKAHGWERIGQDYAHAITRSAAFADAARDAGYDAIEITESGATTWGMLRLGSIVSRESQELFQSDPYARYENDPAVFWHGTPSGDMRGAAYGLHLGTREAARQALEAKIGIPADGSNWDGTKEYGMTLLAGRKTQKLLKEQGRNTGTGYNADAPEEDHYPTGRAKYSGGEPVAMSSHPSLKPFKLIGPMTNSRYQPHDDWKANGYMKAQIKKGNAKRGYFYENVGEDSGSISVVVPSAAHVEELPPVIPSPLFQEKRGSVILANDGQRIIRLFGQADFSTLIHELGHVWLEEARADALGPNASAQRKKDWKATKSWFKANGFTVGDTGQIPVGAHELWARGTERFLMEGKSPSGALVGVFTKFRSWLMSIYSVVENLNSPITPEIRDVFSRLIATQEAIDEQRAIEKTEPLFKTAEEAGMTEAAFADYRSRIGEARDEAYNALLFKTMEALRRKRKAEMRDQRGNIRAEVAAEINAQPGFIALHLLRTGRWLGDPDREQQNVKLNTGWLIDTFGEDILDKLPKGLPITRGDGLEGDAIAEMVGASSGQELVHTLVGMRAASEELRSSGETRGLRDKMIDEEVDRVMADRHGDALTDGSIEEEAIAALNTASQGEIISAEIRQLQKRTAIPGRVTPYQFVREWAKRKVAAGFVRDVASRGAMQRYTRAASKAARAAETAILEGNADEAYRQKQAQLLNHALLAESKAAADRVDVIVARMKRLAGRAAMKSVDQDYMDKVHALLENYDFRERSQKSIDEQEGFQKWMESQRAQGYEVHIPPRLENNGDPYTRVTVEELESLNDVVESLLHLGKTKQSILSARAERDYAEWRDEAVARIALLPDRKLPDKPINEETRRGASAASELLKIEVITEELDGGPTGPLNDMLIVGANDAENKRSELRERVLAPIIALYQGLGRKQWKRLQEKVTLELTWNTLNEGDPRQGTPVVVTRMELLSMALNLGNLSNTEKMSKGERWPVATLQAIVQRELNKEDWNFVQALWTQVELLWPEIVKSERAMSGVVPEKVVNSPIDTRFGTYEGGYWPVVYDASRWQRTEDLEGAKLDDMFGLKSGVATQKGHTIERTAASGPLSYSLENILFSHVEQVVTRIAFAPYARDVLRAIRDTRIRGMIDTKLGPEYRKQIEPWLSRQIHEGAVHAKAARWWQTVLRQFRINMTIAGMGFRLSTGVAQTLGLTASAQRIGARWVGTGMKRMAQNPRAAAQFVWDRSPEMLSRTSTFSREQAELAQSLRGKHSWLSTAQHWAMWHIGMMDRYVVSLPTWLGAHARGMSEGMTDKEASDYADKSVRLSQGSGREKDLSAIQSPNNEAMRFFTMFYTPFNVMFNAQWQGVRGLKKGDVRPAIGVTFWWLLVSTLGDAMLSGDWPEDGDDDDGTMDWGAWFARNVGFGLFAGIPVARDIATYQERKLSGEYASFGTPIDRVVDAMDRSRDIATNLIEDGEAPSRPLKTGGDLAAIFTGLPISQPATTGQFLWDYQAGEADPQSVSDWYFGITKGKVPEQ